MQPCAFHSGLSTRVDNMVQDVAEIKGDVKILITNNAADRGFNALGKAFAVGLGASVPLGGLIWAFFN